MNEKYFPVIKIPQEILEIKNSIPDKPIKPSIPTKPRKPNKKDNTLYWILIPAILAFILIISSIANKNDGNFTLFFLFPIIAYILFYKNAEYKMENNYKKRVKEYNIRVEKYNKEISEFNTAIRYYKENLSKLYEEKSISEYRKSLILKLLKSNISEPVKASRKVNKGSSENFFLQYLKNFFGDKILTNYELGIFEKPYVPDFIYYNSELNLLIDIEIDEPYTLINGKNEPIHYIHNTHDFRRDSYFLSNRWLVIRFAEIQVIKHGKECCELIDCIIKNLIENQQLCSVEKVPKIKIWNEKEAQLMAKENYRMTYL